MVDGDSLVTPPHYKDMTPEPIDVIEGWGLNFCLGNVIKYLARAGRKPGVDAVTDLEKARWYLDREIVRHREEAGGGMRTKDIPDIWIGRDRPTP